MSTTILSVDLDDIFCYEQIHGIRSEQRPGLPTQTIGYQPSVALCHCLPRFLELFDELGVQATFFVIGRDLENDLKHQHLGAQWLIQATKAGHDLGNHSWGHAYDLSTWSAAQIESDLRRCDLLLRQLGTIPQGFRAPGYVHNLRLLSQVAKMGYIYDSSRLPSPPYYAAKLAAIGYKKLLGHASKSQIRGAACFWGQARPFFMTQVGLWEIPISVTPWSYLPMVGTFLLSGPKALSAWLLKQAAIAEYLHIELHAIDLIDIDRDPIPAELRKQQPEFRTPLKQRKERLRKLLEIRSQTNSGFRSDSQSHSRICSIATALGIGGHHQDLHHLG